MKIFISNNIPQNGIDMLKNAGYDVEQFTEERELSQQELIDKCKDVDALLNAGHAKLDNNFFNQCSHLKAVALFSVGYDNVDIQAATQHKIPVSNTPGVLNNSTSDIAFLLMLAVSRKAFYMHDYILHGWGYFNQTDYLGIELYNKTLGIFGLGRVGFEMARKCKGAYNMNIIYHNRSNNVEAEKTLNARYVSFDELLQQSDVLSLHANLSNDTKGIFNKDAFAKMKPTSIFVNAARGGLHNEIDLTEALQNKTIWGAGLDVTNPEPMDKNNPLLTMQNAAVTPHIGSATIETRSAMATIAAQNIVAALQGKPMPQVINKEVYA